MKAILRSWWEVLKALGNLEKIVLKLFWHDPARMLYVVGLSIAGNKEEAQRQIKVIEASMSSDRSG